MIRNNRICFDLPVDNLKTGKVRKVRNTFPTTYGKLDSFQFSLPHFTRGASWKYFFYLGASWLKRGRVGSGASCPDTIQSEQPIKMESVSRMKFVSIPSLLSFYIIVLQTTWQESGRMDHRHSTFNE